MHRVGFEPTTLVFERAKTVHALDRAPTEMGSFIIRIALVHPVYSAIFTFS
jgi:hypothetical protein